MSSSVAVLVSPPLCTSEALSYLEHYHLTGQRSEAVYFSLLGFGIRLSGVLQGAAMFAVGVWFGYLSGEHPGPQPDLAFRFLISVVPVISLVLSMYFAHQFFNQITPDPASKPI